MNGAGAHDDEEAMVFAVEDLDDFGAGFVDGRGGGFGDGEFFFESDGREDDFGPGDAKVIGGKEHGSRLADQMKRAFRCEAGETLNITSSYSLGGGGWVVAGSVLIEW